MKIYVKNVEKVDMASEIWKDVKGYEGDYQVSNLGRLKSLKRNKELIMSQSTDKEGYKVIKLTKYGVEKMYKVHRLVAIAFLENENTLPQVNHKNEIKSDNRVENLEWCTALYNVNYGNTPKNISKGKMKPINQFDLEGNLIKTWDGIKQIIRELKIDGKGIKECLIDEKDSYKNFKWKYKFNKNN